MPGKGSFARCVDSVSKRGGVSDPRAVCAKSIGGKRGRTKGRVNAAREYTLYPGGITFPTAADAKAALIAALDDNPSAYVVTPSGKRLKVRKQRANAGWQRFPTSYGVYKVKKVGDTWWVLTPDGSKFPYESRAAALAHFARYKKNAKGERLTAKERALLGAGRSLAMAKAAPFIALIPNRKKKNPSGRTAEEAYREFHGRDSQEIIEFETTHHFPKRTAAIGDLIELDIKIPRDRHVKGGQYVKLANFGECWLTENPRMKQLYVEGGDQSLDLGEFGLDSSDPHEWEYLGELVRCVYFTTKDHLGKDGGEANYHHRFGKNELTLKKTELIKVGFHVPDEQLWFIGGGYEIPSEGIDG